MKSVRLGKKFGILVFLLVFSMGMSALTVPDMAFAARGQVRSRGKVPTLAAKSRNKGRDKAKIRILIQPGQGITAESVSDRRKGKKQKTAEVDEKNYYQNPDSKEYDRMEVRGKIKKDTSVYSLEQKEEPISTLDSTASAKVMALTQEVDPSNVLILYDAPAGQAYSKMGKVYAIMLYNLVGHFDANVDLLAVNDYTQGTVNQYDTIFYIGSYYGNALPESFLNDAYNTRRTVVWFKYNIWQLAWNGNYNFNRKFGFSFLGMRGLNSTPSVGNPNPGFFDTIKYKGKSMVKHYDYIPESGVVLADPDVGVTQVNNPITARLLVPVDNSATGERVPYIIKSRNFWYVADLPLSFIGPRDRYLVLCDILHDILGGVSHPESHQAMIRLEDVGALVDPGTMETLSDYFLQENIPFSIALIPRYLNPNGVWNDGVPQDISLAQATDLLLSVQYAIARGGSVLMHGYTHQYSNIANPHSAVSGDDFEFWLINSNSPVPEDSVAWADQRILAGMTEMNNVGLFPFAFEFPHYQASPKSYQAVRNRFSTRYERAFYYTSDNPQLNLAEGDPNRDFAAGQFFPYVIKKDYYGSKVLPENLGNIEYDISHIDPTSYIDYGWEELAINADYALTVRDGFASFFFHPFWLETGLGVSGFEDLQSLVQEIKALGFTWIGANDL